MSQNYFDDLAEDDADDDDDGIDDDNDFNDAGVDDEDALETIVIGE